MLGNETIKENVIHDKILQELVFRAVKTLE